MLLCPCIGAVREKSRTIACANSFRQLGLASAACVAACQRFPDNAPLPWTITLCNFTDDQVLAGRFDPTDHDLASTRNRLLGRDGVPLFQCPGDTEFVVPPWDWRASSVTMNSYLIGNRPADCVDGLSNTALAFEVRTELGIPWITGPEFIPIAIDSSHRDFSHFLRADGSLGTLSHSLSQSAIVALANPDGDALSPNHP